MNILTKGVKGREYLIEDMIATRLSKKKFEELQELNEFLQDYRFTPQAETDFSWWSRISKKLTAKKLYSGVYFECDFYGNVREY